MPGGASMKKKKSLFGRILRTVLLIIASAVTAFVLFFAVKILSLDAWKDFDPERITSAAQTLIVYDSQSEELTRLDSGEDRVLVAIDEIPLYVQKAFISAEDARYYEHPGIDVIRILGAAWQDIKAGSYVQGASTITQQLIKLSHLSAEKTISRKLEEAVLAYQMEKQFTKDEILEMYLNYVYFGRGYYGVEAASLGYFGIHCGELTLEQGATLAGILKSPSKYAPHIAPEASKNRRDNILSLMQQYGYISEEEKTAAQAKPLTIIPAAQTNDSYYIEAALDEAMSITGMDRTVLLSSGYRIYTAQDTGMQSLCDELFDDDELFPADDCEGAIAVVKTDDTSVTALIGGRENVATYSFNRATDIRRQPGSVIKPVIVYAPALQYAGYTAASLILDERTDFNGYSPRNFADKYYGWVTMREAVKRSLNVPAVKLMEDIGVNKCKDFAASVGVEFDEADTSLTLALGGFSYGVSPLEMAGAYASFAAGGEYATPYFVRCITDSDGNAVYTKEDDRLRVMSEENAFILTSMLQSAISEGTGRRLGELGLGLAGKTGTVGEGEGNRDAWMAAYSPQYSACVWMGYDSSNDGALPGEATGGSYPALMLSRLYSYIYPSVQDVPAFNVPEGIIEVRLDSYTLKEQHMSVLANAFTPSDSTIKEYFALGTEPDVSTSYWSVPSAVHGFGVSLSPEGIPVVKFNASESNAVYILYRSKDGGLEEAVKKWNGGSGAVRYEDEGLAPGTYTYHVVPVHAKLTLAGKSVAGVSSARISVNVSGTSEYAPQMPDEMEIEDTEIQD